jgi:phospholipid/cholesterol/gamma-HCH transport system permease protein
MRQPVPPVGERPTVRAATARREPGQAGTECVIKVGGEWRLSGPVPTWTQALGTAPTGKVSVVPEQLGRWDTSLALFLVHGRDWCAHAPAEFDTSALPGNLQALLRQFSDAGTARPAVVHPAAHAPSGIFTLARTWTGHGRDNVAFLGECTLSLVGVACHPRRFRLLDCLVEMQKCWASSLPIVCLVSFLVGVILAFQAAVQLQPFGAAVFVADLVGLAVVREMGPMMAAVVVAGGTGAGFAAQLGNMKVDDEIDALETLGISAIDFLTLPRVLAVTLMLPVLTVYANTVGILGGMFVSATLLDISTSAYWQETQDRVRFADVASGLIKSVCFGLAVGLAGCLRGMRCERSAAGVGAATSSAVVTGILLIVLADAGFSLIFHLLDF